MGVLLQGFYKTKPNNAVPSPADGNPSIPWWWDNLAAQADMFRQAGFSAVWLPPVLKTASGASKGADGYGPFDDYDIGSRHQKGSTPTRFGTREQLHRCVAIMRANGLDVYVDMVEHHRSGDTTPFTFRYPGADGTNGIGRFPKNRDNFIPNVPRDPHLGGPVKDDQPFGRELAPINGKPPAHYVSQNLVDAADWLTRALDLQGYRIDDVKGLSTDFLHPFLTTKAMTGKFAVGEFFDGNRVLVNGWVQNPRGMQGRCHAFDFPLKFILNQMCNNPGNFNMADLDGAGLIGIAALNAVTFVENHDTDREADQSIAINKILAYAFILTSQGYPCVYYRDYDMGVDGYKLKPGIDNLIWIHEKLAAGPTQQRWKDFDVFAYERLGGSHLLVGLNNDPGNSRTITVATGFGPGKTLNDYAGHAPKATTDGNGNVAITIPRNNNGEGYVCYSLDGQGGAFGSQPLAANQTFEGAQDLDILPAANGKPIQAGRIWCAANTPVRAKLDAVTVGWTKDTAILLELLAPDGHVLGHQVFTSQTPANAFAQVNTTAKGFHTLRLTLSNAPADNPAAPYKLSVTYTATQTLDLAAEATANIASATESSVIGQWTDILPLANVPIHAHLLPTGKVLFWGRRKTVGAADFDSLNEHETHAFIWDPANPSQPGKPTSGAPLDGKGNTINLFCSGHTFLADGTLVVTGGHLFDSQGHDSTTFYDCFTDKWTAAPRMNHGRWYPTAVTLGDGRGFVCGGSYADGVPAPPAIPPAPPNKNDQNNIPQALIIAKEVAESAWQVLRDFGNLPLFPRFHLTPDGSLFMPGSLQTTYLLKNPTPGNLGDWVPTGQRSLGNADYAPSVMYEPGKVVYFGGGGGDDKSPQPPANQVETIDLTVNNPAWSIRPQMKFRRRQHNATLLPDGSILVTGGSQGPGFDNLNKDIPVHPAELWDPATGAWTTMASEKVDRCYHSTAVLLPDGRVFSGGGGEYAPDENVHAPNPAVNSHANAQLFSPPYLFKGAPPVITKAPDTLDYGTDFQIATADPPGISMVTLVRLSSVTHSFNMNQRINFLVFKVVGGQLTATAPPNSNVCPPGHYMLFILNSKKVPSIAKIVSIGSAAAAAPVAQLAAARLVAPTAPTPVEQDAVIQQREKDPPLVVGVTAGCPYGISACWGGAYEALSRMSGVRLVRPVPDAKDSTAFLYLEHPGLPDLDAWTKEFARIANGTHQLHGVEVTEQGLVDLGENGALLMRGTVTRPPLPIYPLIAEHKVQLNPASKTPKPMEQTEQQAWEDLEEKVRAAGGSLPVSVTGPLKKSDDRYIIEVRKFSLAGVEVPACCGNGNGHQK